MKWFDRDFYEHLWKVSDRYGEDWFKVVPDDDPDLMYCQEYTERKLKESGYISEDKIRERICKKIKDNSILSIKQMAQELDMTKRELSYKLVKMGLLNKAKALITLRNSYILSEDGKKISYIFTSKYTMSRHISASVKQKITPNINSGNYVCGWKIYDYRGWLENKGNKKRVNLSSECEEKLINEKVVRL